VTIPGPARAVSPTGSRGLCFAIALAAVSLVASGPPGDDLGGQVDRALARGMQALVRAQSADGSWRSPTYGIFKDGLTLTPTVLKALAFGPDVEAIGPARTRGARYLIDRIRPDGTIDDGPTGLIYPVYTASGAVLTLSRLDQGDAGRRSRDAWLRDLRRRQLTEDLGWRPDDPGYGAWGYSTEPPRKAPGSDGPADADLSSTLFALGALRVAGVPADDPAVGKALVFIQRCQNVDGGFFLTPTDPVRNKAGTSGLDPSGRPRYRSYGSATADGLRALLRGGLAPDHPRVVAAQSWLEHHFSATTNPGTFDPIRADDREATYFYYAWSLSHAFRTLGVREISADGRTMAWPEALSRELLRRQRPDGTWANRYTASKEDDPLVATSFAVAALGNCRMMMPPLP
jgi:squalene-hopene/tetraprenyl-beta-curcumene cyclase